MASLRKGTAADPSTRVLQCLLYSEELRVTAPRVASACHGASCLWRARALEAMHQPIHPAVAPSGEKCGEHRIVITAQPCREGVEIRAVSAGNPWQDDRCPPRASPRCAADRPHPTRGQLTREIGS